jgi:hypothetical protein
MPIAGVRFARIVRATLCVGSVFLSLTGLFTGGIWMTMHNARGDDVPTGPRAAAWKAVDKAIEEGKPKTAAAAPVAPRAPLQSVNDFSWV